MAMKAGRAAVRSRTGRVRATGTVSVTATEAKNEFGRLFESALAGRPVVITKHGIAKAVLVSKAGFDALSGTAEPNLDALTGEFDVMLARMQTASARKAMRRAFDASPEELGRAAVVAARRRG